MLIKPLDLESLAEPYFDKRWQRFIIGWAGQLVSPLFFRRGPSAVCQDITVQAVDQFDASFDEFWERVQDKYPVMLVRDQAFLAWRFAKVSGRHYQVLVARAADRMLGYTVLRCTTIRGFKTGLVMDMLLADDPLSATVGAGLMAEAEAYFRAQHMSIAAALMASYTAEYRVLRRAGYRSLPNALTPRPFYLAFFIHSDAKDWALLTAQDWFATIADHESL
jgi:hypothetical protein